MITNLVFMFKFYYLLGRYITTLKLHKYKNKCFRILDYLYYIHLK